MAERLPVPPPVIRSRVILEVAGGLIGSHVAWRQAKVTLRPQGGGPSVCLFGCDAPDVIAEVAAGRIDLGIVNPSGVLTAAYRGVPPFPGPMPVRVVSVLPSRDELAFAVKADTGLESVEDIAVRRYPLRVSLRAQRDHAVHWVVDHVARACGFSLYDLQAWGGRLSYDEGLPWAPNRLGAVERGEVDAIFDEAAPRWVARALELGMRILPLGEATLRRLEGWGYRRARIDVGSPPGVLAVDFSGWPLYVREDASAHFVESVCRGLEAGRESLPWDGDGPLPLAEMCRGSDRAPRDVPLHEAAERFWRERGYL